MLIFDQLRKGDGPLRLLTLAVLAGLLVLLTGLWWVQVVSSKRYVESEKTQSFRTVRIPAVRGAILDRNGLVLAEDRASYNAGLYLESMSPRFRADYRVNLQRATEEAGRRLTRKERDQLAFDTRYQAVSNVVHELSLVLDEPITVSARGFHNHFFQAPVLPFPILENLSPEQIARFEEQPVNPLGMDLDVQPLRVYPNGTSAAHLIGYVRRTDDFSEDDQALSTYRLQDIRGSFRGAIGVERAFDEYLRGRAGVKFVQINNLGYRQSEEIWADAQPGRNLVLTLDLPLQQFAEEALRSTPMGPNVRGAAVVLNVNNGDILALASNPAFDPNIYLGRISHEDFARLNDPELRPQYNRATQGVYPPGSIFKIISGLAALEAGVVGPDDVYYNRGYYPIGNGINDEAPPGDYNFHRAMSQSSNSYFIEYGLRARMDRLMDMGGRFFLGQSAEVPTMQNHPGFFPTPEWIQEQRRLRRPWTDGMTANICIGQGEVAVTPLQMALATAAIANGGNVFWPRLAERIESQGLSGQPVETVRFPPRLRGELGVQQKHLEMVRNGMLASVEDPAGTGRFARVPGFRIAGKTGTAEVKTGRRLDHKITWFTSFGPYEYPRYAVLVMIERGASGGGTCGPVAQRIYREIMRRELQAPATQTAGLPARIEDGAVRSAELQLRELAHLYCAGGVFRRPVRSAELQLRELALWTRAELEIRAPTDFFNF